MALALIVINWLSVLALTAALVAGLASAYAFLPVEVDARSHITLAMSSSFLVLFAHSMTMFYFIGTGVRIKELTAEHAIEEDLVGPTRRFKARVFPFATMALLLTMATFILGGGVDTGSIPGWIHLLCGLAAWVLNYLAVLKETGAINQNVRLFDHLESIVVARMEPGAGEAS